MRLLEPQRLSEARNSVAADTQQLSICLRVLLEATKEHNVAHLRGSGQTGTVVLQNDKDAVSHLRFSLSEAEEVSSNVVTYGRAVGAGNRNTDCNDQKLSVSLDTVS